MSKLVPIDDPRLQIKLLSQVVDAIGKDMDARKLDLDNHKKRYEEDLAYLQKHLWRVLFAWPDMVLSRWILNRKTRLYNMKVAVLENLLRQIKEARACLAEDAQFNQTFE